MIYLDNAATSFPKPRSVIRETLNCIKKYCANSGRSSHRLAVKTSEEIYKAREAVSDLVSLGAPENVCFTTNATYALNIAIKTLITSPCHILISDIEHNSVLRPIHKLKEKLGVEYSCFTTDGSIRESIESQIRKNTRAVVCNLVSNVTGEEIPLEIISEICRERGLVLIIDASQIIGHREINLQEFPCDALCAPAHKGLFGIQGCGFVAFGRNIPKESLIEGGSGNESLRLTMPELPPEHFEAGTLPAPAIVALKAGIEYINGIGVNTIRKRLEYLTELFRERIEQIDKIEIFGAQNGIISFRAKGYPSAYISEKLNEYDIYTRSGLHCAPLIHKKLGTTDTGLVRMSLSFMTGKSDADSAYTALKSICNDL